MVVFFELLTSFFSIVLHSRIHHSVNHSIDSTNHLAHDFVNYQSLESWHLRPFSSTIDLVASSDKSFFDGYFQSFRYKLVYLRFLVLSEDISSASFVEYTQLIGEAAPCIFLHAPPQLNFLRYPNKPALFQSHID